MVVLTHLLLVREDSADDDVVQGLLGLQAEALGDSFDPLGAKIALRVKIDHLALATTCFVGQLTGHTQSVHELGLAGAELSEHLGDRSGFNAASEDAVESSGAGGHANDRSALLLHLQACLKLISSAVQLFASFADLLNSGFSDSLDGE